MAMKHISEAPKEGLILLYLPEFGASGDSWWVGQWSWVKNNWVVRSPFTMNGKLVVTEDIPEPLGWHDLPSP